MRTALDLTPLYRSMIGADHFAEMVEAALGRDDNRSYPPYDIEKTGAESYRISLATPGFQPQELELTFQPNLLIVAGRKAEREGDHRYLHQGIARAFERRFELAEHVTVRAADYSNGLLTVELAREVPEALKPRKIEIGDTASVTQISDRRTSRPRPRAA